MEQRQGQFWLSQCSSAFKLAALMLSLASPLLAETSGVGQRLYESKGCYQCHGYAGQGGVAGPRLAPNPIPIAAFQAIVRKPPNVMPAYSPNVLSDAELAAIYRFVTSLE